MFLGKVLIYIIFCNVNKSLLVKDKNIVSCFATRGYLPVPVLSTLKSKRTLSELSQSLPGSHCCKLTSKTCSFSLGPKLQQEFSQKAQTVQKQNIFPIRPCHEI